MFFPAINFETELLAGETWPGRDTPKKEVESALAEAEVVGWTVTPTPSGHRWGVMRCGETSRSGCQVSIWSTPRNAGGHANQLRRAIRRWLHEWV